MMATGAQGLLGRYVGPDVALQLSIPFGVFCGMMVGLVNGIGVAYLRAPSMIFTLGVNAVAQGLMVYHTGGFSPQDGASTLMRDLAVGRLIPGVPNPLLIWIAVGGLAVFMLTRTTLGRRIYAIGNKERAVYLSGVNAKLVVLVCFVIAGGCAALGGVLLAGWSNRSFQAMGDPYLLPAIASVVLGGANVMGGKGRYLGTVAGVILITLLMSILSVLQPQTHAGPTRLEDSGRFGAAGDLWRRGRRHAPALRPVREGPRLGPPDATRSISTSAPTRKRRDADGRPRRQLAGGPEASARAR